MVKPANAPGQTQATSTPGTLAAGDPDSEVLRQAVAWLQQGREVVLVTVLQIWGSAPRPAGSLLAVTRDGAVSGSVSGGCMEEELQRRIAEPGFPGRRPARLAYGGESSRRLRGLPCGGRVELLLEELRDIQHLQTILRTVEGRGTLVRRIRLADGTASLHPAAARTPSLRLEQGEVEKLFGPVWRLLIIGAVDTARYLARIALTLGYEVIVSEPRPERASGWRLPGARLDPRMPDDAVRALADDPRSAVVTLTHDPRLDDMALMVALDSQAFYVGALGSHRTSAGRRERLATLEVSEAGLRRLHAPVGLPIGSHTPPEIAVAIAAEMTARRHGVSLAGRGNPAER